MVSRQSDSAAIVFLGAFEKNPQRFFLKVTEPVASWLFSDQGLNLFVRLKSWLAAGSHRQAGSVKGGGKLEIGEMFEYGHYLNNPGVRQRLTDMV